MSENKKSHIKEFKNAPRNDESKPRRVRCLNPFRWLEVGDAGYVTPCCSPWFKGNLGKLGDQSMEEIWNGEKFQEVREAMYEGGNWEKFCNAETCPQIKNDTWVPIDFISADQRDNVPITQEVLDQVREGKTIMDVGPTQVGVACDPRCNLKCIMCSTLTNPNRDGTALRAAIDGINQYLPDVKRLKMMGDGEVFAVPESRKFLFEFDAEANPDTSFLIHTNGILLTPKLWEKIEHIKIDWMVVSMDAATKETFEKIRVGGNWEKLRENLDFLIGKYREGIIRELHINMCVMKSNHHEILDFAKLGKSLGVTSAYYMPIFGDYAEEQIFGRRDVDALMRITKQLEHPIMSDPCIDTNAIDEWRGYKPGFQDRKIQAKQRLKKALPSSIIETIKKVSPQSH